MAKQLLMNRKSALLAFAAMAIAVPSHAQRLSVTIENLSPTDGFFLTPTWIGLHNGSFDLFDVGGTASAALEGLAEEGVIGMPGDAGTLADAFAAPGRLQGVITGPSGFGSVMPQPPLIDTGEVASTEISLINPAAYRYLSFASMVIPSNDAFIANDDPQAYEVFDALGAFNGPFTIDILGADIWDAGTEVNDTLGAAFSADGGVSTDEGGTVQVHPGLSNFEGVNTPVGPIGAGLAPGASTPLARITVSLVPEPTTALLAALAAAGALVRRR